VITSLAGFDRGCRPNRRVAERQSPEPSNRSPLFRAKYRCVPVDHPPQRPSCMSFERIAATLNAEGMPTRTPGKRWQGFAVNQILKRANEVERESHLSCIGSRVFSRESFVVKSPRSIINALTTTWPVAITMLYRAAAGPRATGLGATNLHMGVVATRLARWA
jgi:hypothetical protein